MLTMILDRTLVKEDIMKLMEYDYDQIRSKKIGMIIKLIISINNITH